MEEQQLIRADGFFIHQKKKITRRLINRSKPAKGVQSSNERRSIWLEKKPCTMGSFFPVSRDQPQLLSRKAVSKICMEFECNSAGKNREVTGEAGTPAPTPTPHDKTLSIRGKCQRPSQNNPSLQNGRIWIHNPILCHSRKESSCYQKSMFFVFRPRMAS